MCCDNIAAAAAVVPLPLSDADLFHFVLGVVRVAAALHGVTEDVVGQPGGRFNRLPKTLPKILPKTLPKTLPSILQKRSISSTVGTILIQ